MFIIKYMSKLNILANILISNRFYYTNKIYVYYVYFLIRAVSE